MPQKLLLMTLEKKQKQALIILHPNNNNNYSKKPVLVKIAFLTLLRSRPLSVLPFPSHTEEEQIWLLASFLAIHSCGGTISSSSSSSSTSSPYA
ncbi:LOW QUALITY PROTEIN: hypothetical protein PanWU01x14_270470 [Parasponia andersonii]|uniref:Uncharacterized protein n=1 Tax=Parasponia andersonii TaxID=3476 RepID=A0A2P5B560_PARAD|nr:LOW QUALITY PROTEIN: hypothetical protein PanWU01x14_270470 [Parasponia andersonii]